MAYLVPRVQINQEFTQVATFSDQPLAALVFGPQFNLYRYNVAAEKANTVAVNPDGINGNAYQSGTNVTYEFPNQVLGTQVDSNFVQVYFENAAVAYFPNDLGNTAITVNHVPVPNVTNKFYPNRFVATNLVFQTANNINRSVDFGLRDVTPGDQVSLANGGTSFLTRIKAIHASNSVATVGAVVGATGDVDTHLPTVAGTYTGPNDLTYTLTVVRGGNFYDGNSNGGTCARVSVTSTNVDSSPTVNVQSAVAIPLGSYGLTATFTSATGATALTQGDSFLVSVVSAKPAAMNIIETYDTLPATLVSGTAWNVAGLRNIQNFQVSAQIPGDDADLNWVVDPVGQTITINSGIGAPVAGVDDGNFDVVSANVFIQHRDLVTSNSISIGALNTPDQVEAILGTVDPANPLAQGVYNAALNANGVTTYYCAVATNDINGYNGVLALAKKVNSYYSLVPLTLDVATQEAVVAHVNAMSTPNIAKWRVAWLSANLQPNSFIFNNQTNGNPFLGTIGDNPFITGNQYTMLTVAGATFLSTGVRATDNVLINFTVDAQGDTVNDTYVVASVLTETTLLLEAGPDAAIITPTKVQIQRVYTLDEQFATLAGFAEGYTNRRVRCVFPGLVANGTTVMSGYQAAAALAGLRAGVAPHQGLTNTTLLGFTNVSGIHETFTSDQLDVLGAAGFYILTQDVPGGQAYVRHQLTSDMTSLNTSEDSVTANVDSISYGLQSAMSPYIGKYNVDPTAVNLIRAAIISQLNFYLTDTYTASAGNQLIDYTLVSLKQNPTFLDRVDATINLTIPYPLNYLVITLVV